MADPQDEAEALDDDKLDDRNRYDGEPAADYPPDELLGADDYGITDREQAVDEPIHERERRYQPDPLAVELDRASGGTPAARQTSVGSEEDEDEDLRLVDAAGGPDGRLAGEGVEAEDLSAEEAAIHVVDE
jgi:hypothetical protein